MKLIVGLGNPGSKYKKTRHNLGFNIIDEYIKSNKLMKNSVRKNELKRELLISQIHGEEVLFLKPLNYINNSGSEIKKILKKYRIDINDLLVVSDDKDQDIGKMKFKLSSSSGGHNGLRDIEASLNTRDFNKLKIGVGNPSGQDTSNYVLSKFTREQIQVIRSNYSNYFKEIDIFIKGN